MGACLSQDVVPDLPVNIRDDPAYNAVISVSASKMGGARDWSVYDGDIPSSDDEKREKLWLWFNKEGDGQIGTIFKQLMHLKFLLPDVIIILS